MWLLFSDDDDLWHPRRSALVRRACAAAAPHEHALTFPIYAYPVKEGAHGVVACAEVDLCIARRSVALWLGSSEVFQFAVRAPLLRGFLRAEPPAVLRHRFADVRFAQYVRQQHKRHAREVTPAQLMRLAGLQDGASGEGAPAVPLARAPGGGAALASQLSQVEHQVGLHVNSKADIAAHAARAAGWLRLLEARGSLEQDIGAALRWNRGWPSESQLGPRSEPPPHCFPHRPGCRRTGCIITGTQGKSPPPTSSAAWPTCTSSTRQP